MSTNTMSGKKMMIVGAARGQLGLYKAAKQMGIKVVAAGKLGNYPGLKYADVICPVDILSPEDVLEAAIDQHVDAIASCCADTGIESLGYVNDRLGLSGVGYSAAKSAGSKKLLREALEKAGVPIAEGKVLSSADNARELIDALGLPIVVKRFSSQGSSGVYVERTVESAVGRIEEVLALDGECLVEEFLKGEEFGAQAFVFGGEVLFVAPHKDLLYLGNAPMPVGHWLPFSGDESKNKKVYDMVKAAILAVGFDNCAVNVDLKENGDDLRLIELTGRAGANGLPELMSALFGRNYYDAIIEAAFGEKPKFTRALGAETVVVKMVMSRNRGVLNKFNDELVSDNVMEARAFIEDGSRYEGFESLRDCIGQILVKGSSYEECDNLFYLQAEKSFGLEKEMII